MQGSLPTEVIMSLHKIAVALPLEEKLLKPLYQWGERFDWSEIHQVDFIHIVKKNLTPIEFGMIEMPDEKTFREMIPTLEQHLKLEAEKILPKAFKGKINYHLSKEFSPEEGVIKSLKDFKTELIVLSTRGKHGFQGLFHSSFADKMLKYAPCDVYVVRPETVTAN
jgi:nucleotide-binding universal stress UspA family protein